MLCAMPRRLAAQTARLLFSRACVRSWAKTVPSRPSSKNPIPRPMRSAFDNVLFMMIPPKRSAHSPNIPAHCQARAPSRANTFRVPNPMHTISPPALLCRHVEDRMNFSRLKTALLLTALLAAACQQPTKPGSPIAADNDLRDTLAAMARAHDQKTQLAFYESLPWQRTAEPFHTFFVNMGKSQRELYDQLQAWAKTADHGAPMVLKYTYSDDTP